MRSRIFPLGTGLLVWSARSRPGADDVVAERSRARDRALAATAGTDIKPLISSSTVVYLAGIVVAALAGAVSAKVIAPSGQLVVVFLTAAVTVGLAAVLVHKFALSARQPPGHSPTESPNPHQRRRSNTADARTTSHPLSFALRVQSGYLIPH
jgi:hypothetical protein